MIAYDLSQLFLLGPLAATPRGIDRIDFLLADHVFTKSNTQAVGVLPTPRGIRVIDADAVRVGLRHLEGLWQETIDPDCDRSWLDLCARLTGSGSAGVDAPKIRSLSLPDQLLRIGKQLRRTGLSQGKPVRSALPESARYVNIGQTGLSAPFLFRWLQARPDVCAVFMMHDVIPLEFPEHVLPVAVAMHKRMVRTIARYGHGLIVPSRHAGESISAALSPFGRKDLPVFARHLPLASVFAEGGNAPPELEGITYFVICGSIEPRKNHGLLIDVWRRLIGRLGKAAPHLVIVGSPAWRGEEILGPVKTDKPLQGRVHQVSRLSSPALRHLLIGSAGLLMPSFAEGFGLPVLEANALGVPTIASDIGAHREIANKDTMLLSPGDAEAWEAAILLQSRAPHRTGVVLGPHYSQADYGKDIMAFVEESAARHVRSLASGREGLSDPLPDSSSSAE